MNTKMTDTINEIPVIRKIHLIYRDETLEPFSDESFIYLPMIFPGDEPVYMKIPKELFKYEGHK